MKFGMKINLGLTQILFNNEPDPDIRKIQKSRLRTKYPTDPNESQREDRSWSNLDYFFNNKEPDPEDTSLQQKKKLIVCFFYVKAQANKIALLPGGGLLSLSASLVCSIFYEEFNVAIDNMRECLVNTGNQFLDCQLKK